MGRAFLQDPRARGGGHRWRQGRSGRGAGQAREAACGGRSAADPPRPVRIPGGGACPVGAPRPSCNGGGALRRGDRKSTRLNSSHLVISYAVFCFKKKNKYRRVMNPS